jgi:predicted ATPase
VITNLKIENFRCFKHVDVPLRPITVLVGNNNTGKSAFLDAIVSLRDQGKLDPSDIHSLNPKNSLVLTADTPAGERRATLDLSDQPEGDLYGGRTGGDFSGPLDDIAPVGLYQLPAQGIQLKSKGVPDTGDAPLIKSDGSNVPALLDYLKRREWKSRFPGFVEAMCQHVPGLQDVDVRSPEAVMREVFLFWEGGHIYPQHKISSGVRLIIFFIALAYHPTPPRVILLEEPENGVHPKRLAEIVKLLREIAAGKHGEHPAQIILTTHSPYLLDEINLDEDQVLVFTRQDDGSRIVEPADKERLKRFLGEFLLGEVWFNRGEEGLVKKR